MIHHSEGLEKCYSTMIFSKRITETLLLKNSKNPKNNPENWHVNNNGVLYH